jgi:hypothetical protein
VRIEAHVHPETGELLLGYDDDRRRYHDDDDDDDDDD